MKRRYNMNKLITAATLAVASCAASPVAAQEPLCAPAENVQNILQDQFGEIVVARGVDAMGYGVEFWLNDETGSWTITFMREGVRCIATGGSYGERAPFGEAV